MHFRPRNKRSLSPTKNFFFLLNFRPEKYVFNSLFMEVEGNKETQTVKFTNCLRNQHERNLFLPVFVAFVLR